MTQPSNQNTFPYAHLAESDSGLVQGFSVSRLAGIAAVIQEQVEANHFPGAVTMVARHGEVVHYAAHGFQDAAKSKRMSKDSIFRLASMTKPLVTAAVNEMHGSLTTRRPFETRADGTNWPGYRDLYPEKPPAGAIPACSEAGVLGALCGVIGSLQAIEVIRQITPFGTPLVGRLLMIDALDMRFRTVKLRRDPACALCGPDATIRDLAAHDGAAPLVCAAV